jgi:hypothetical protein
MLTLTQQRARAAAAEQVFALLHRYRLTVEELTEIGGADLKSPDPARAGKARCVEKAWALMARLGVKHVDIERLLASGVPRGGVVERQLEKASKINRMMQSRPLVQSPTKSTT